MASPEPHSMNNNSLDDIFGSSPPPETTPHRAPDTTTNATEPSELPSLRRQHVTAGYRDGVSASKGEHVQAGFDAGFPVGAQLGMRAGTALGILEGILRGYESRATVKKQPVRATKVSMTDTSTGPATAASVSASVVAETGEGEVAERQAKKEEILKLYRRAVADLDLQAVFAGLHGIEGEEPEVQLGRKGDVAVSKWEKRVEVARWEENMEALEMIDGGGQDKTDVSDVPGRS